MPAGSFRPILACLAVVLLMPAAPCEIPAVGADAAAAADSDSLRAQVRELRSAGRYADALDAARSLAESLRGDPAARAWEVVGADAEVETLELVATFTGDAQSELAEADRLGPGIVEAANAGKYESGVALVRRQLEIRRRLLGDDHLDVAASLDKLASLLRFQGDFAGAESPAREALRIRRERLRGDHPAIAHTLSNLGVLLARQGDLAGAEAAQREALEMRRRTLGEEHEDFSESLNNVAMVYVRQGAYAKAEPLLREVLAIERTHRGDEHDNVARALSALAHVLVRRGKLLEADPLFRETLALRRTLLGEEHPLVARSTQALAACLYDQGDLARAEPLYRRALSLKRRLLGEDHPETAVSVHDLANLLATRGDHLGAESLYREALAIRKRVYGEEHTWIATSLDGLARELLARGEPGEAEHLFREALEMRRKLLGNGHREVALSLEGLAEALLQQGDLDGADPLLREALAMRRELLGDDHPEVAGSLEALAGLAERRRDYESAERLYREALAVRHGALDRPSLPVARTRRAIAECVLAQGDPATAESLFVEAAEAFELARLRAGSGLARATVLESPYEKLAATRLALGEYEAAWNAAERALGRALGDLLMESGRPALDPARAARQDSLKRELRDLESRLAALEELSRTDSSATVLDELRDARTSLLFAEAEWSTLQEEIAVEHPVAAGEAFALERVQATLPESAALLGWLRDEQPGGDRVGWGYVIRASGSVHWVAIEAPAFTDGVPAPAVNVREFREDLATAAAWPLRVTDVSAITGDARRLWECWLAPLVPHLAGVTSLIIIPSGPLCGTPVEAFVDSRGAYVADIYSVSYTPSATICAWQCEKWREWRRPTDRRALLVGDPPFSDDQLAAMTGEESVEDVILATAEVVPGPDVLRSALAGNADALASLPRLPGSREEIARVTAVIPDAVTLLGPRATEQEIVRLAEEGALQRFDTIHLATHALVDDERPERSALVLSRADLPDAYEAVLTDTRLYDGLLTVKEIAREWDLGADLVTLSGCQTALGREVPGEGHVGLAHAFLQAGARSLLVSLWKVQDEATSLLMGRFYENLTGVFQGERGGRVEEPMPKTEALREAKTWLRTLQDADGQMPYRHPAYWAGFVLFGDAT